MGLHSRSFLFLALWLLGASAMALSLAWPFWPASPPEAPAADRAPEAPMPPPIEMELAEAVPGVRQPPARPAAEADLADDEPVVGVTEGGRSRAYALRALSHSGASHVVNDVLGDVPVSVTYCDLYHCTRIYTGGTPDEPLDLAVGGVKQGGLILRAGGHAYRQDSGAPLDPNDPPFPYDLHAGALQTWGEWRHAHPDTDVYLGAAGTEPKPEAVAVPEPPSGTEPKAVKAVPPDGVAELLASALYVGAAPLLIGCATLLLHVLLAYHLAPRRQGRGATP